MSRLEYTHAFFCDADGNELLGSDGCYRVDLRYGQTRRDMHAASIRHTYMKHMRSKYDAMTHYKFRGVIREVPTEIS